MSNLRAQDMTISDQFLLRSVNIPIYKTNVCNINKENKTARCVDAQTCVLANNKANAKFALVFGVIEHSRKRKAEGYLQNLFA